MISNFWTGQNDDSSSYFLPSSSYLLLSLRIFEMLGQLGVVMSLVGLGHCTSNSSSGKLSSVIISFSVAGAVLLVLFMLFFFCSPRRARRRRENREEMRSMALDQGEVAASSQTHILHFSQNLAIAVAQDHDSQHRNIDQRQLPPSPTVSEAPTPRQQHLRAQSQNITAKITELEGLVPRLHDAEAEIARLRAENQWLRDQEQSDWARGLTDSPPPSYREPSIAGTT
ncbi:hypothetical protein C8J56DRAFT_978850 [Mycena floridula]|nr:hypothetical protein C8J56DRAFT_978850 [Mycena floridula]